MNKYGYSYFFSGCIPTLHWHKFMQPEDFWIRAPRKGIVVFALPGEPGLTELVGDFKICFHDRQGDFYWSANDIPNSVCHFY